MFGQSRRGVREFLDVARHPIKLPAKVVQLPAAGSEREVDVVLSSALLALSAAGGRLTTDESPVLRDEREGVERMSSNQDDRPDHGTTRVGTAADQSDGGPADAVLTVPDGDEPVAPGEDPDVGATASLPDGAGDPDAGATVTRRRDAGDLVVRAGAAFQSYREGTPGAIDELVRLVSPLLWHTARQCGLTGAESEDVVQQTFMLLVRHKDSISDPLAVVRWMTVSLRRMAWREKAAGSKRSGEEPTDQDLPRSPSAEHSALLTDQQRRLWALVSELPERCRRLLAVIAFAPKPDYARIATDLGIPIGSIGPTRGRCLAKLRARLDKGEWS